MKCEQEFFFTAELGHCTQGVHFLVARSAETNDSNVGRVRISYVSVCLSVCIHVYIMCVCVCACARALGWGGGGAGSGAGRILMVKLPFMVRWVDSLIPHAEPTELFLIPASASDMM